MLVSIYHNFNRMSINHVEYFNLLSQHNIQYYLWISYNGLLNFFMKTKYQVPPQQPLIFQVLYDF